ncbi:unnamed protein product [Kuraishia capsulata CBS 1993]|uniref:Serine protease n=1 Tax=Kuraishia capsulata CBS 1993 TaxID=1382522 RepID=W6MTT1_9ASCO|nr:uncharacterized protein KUCA_T00001192001 [Kuraishia capsulata CBS 1993]CDK25225.1 unnamed protein product [Kuraishia capsulata CBS 1993]
MSLYQPVTIRIVSKRTRNAVIGVSGIFLKHGEAEYVIALSQLPAGFEKDSFEVYFTSMALISNGVISWVRCKFGSVNTISDNLLFQDFGGFGVVPNITDGIGVVLVLKPLGHTRDHDLRPIRFTRLERSTPACEFESCPFGLSNVSIFSGFRACADILYSDPNGAYYLADLKYMDNMIGGNVCLGANSVGLVYGGLRKVNGDGEVMLVISWKVLARYLPFKLEIEEPIRNTEATIQRGLSNVDVLNRSVVRISTVSPTGQHHWGSGVLVAPNVVVTNRHVLIAEGEPMSARILVTFSSGITVEVEGSTLAAAVSIPFEFYDLCFIKSELFAQKELGYASVANTPITDLVTDLERFGAGSRIFAPQTSNDNVTTIGFGLMQNKAPMVSSGHKNFSKELALFDNLPNVNVLAIVSASSWSGSSGGGVFHSNGQFVGIMVCNGRLSTGEVLSRFTLVIPWQIVVIGFYKVYGSGSGTKRVIEVSAPARSECEALWGLREPYNDVFIENLKL